MKCAGIVAEYNPFHLGHAYQIAQTRAALGGEGAVVCAMSGHWVQQANCAITDKWTRAGLALRGGADLVLELPTVWAVSSAEYFARGAVDIMAASGVVTHLSFGSECGDADKLRQVAACLDSPVYQAGLSRFLDEGMPFAACRQAVARGILGEALAGLLSKPNNNLGVEYIRAVRALGSGMVPMTVRRRGAGHHGGGEPGEFASATEIRRLLEAGRWAEAEALTPPGTVDTLRRSGPADLSRCERAMLARARVMRAEDWAALPDGGGAEGLPRRLIRAAGQAGTLREFYALAKTKRYTEARIRRLLLWAFLGLTAADRPGRVPYLRVLGMNGRGRALLREMKAKAALPVITKPAHARELPEEGRRLFELEGRCTDLYGLCFETARPCGEEWTNTPVVAALSGASGGQDLSPLGG